MKAIITSDGDGNVDDLGLRLVSEGANDLVLMRMLERRYPAIVRNSPNGNIDLAVPILEFPNADVASGAVAHLIEGYGIGRSQGVPVHVAMPGEEFVVAWTNRTRSVVRDLHVAFDRPDEWILLEVAVNGRARVGRVEDVVPGALVNLLVRRVNAPAPSAPVEAVVECVASGVRSSSDTKVGTTKAAKLQIARTLPIDITLWSGPPDVDVAAGVSDLAVSSADARELALLLTVSEVVGSASPPGQSRPASAAVAVGESVEFSTVVDGVGRGKLVDGDVAVIVESGAEWGIVDIGAKFVYSDGETTISPKRYIMAGNGEVRTLWLRDAARSGSVRGESIPDHHSVKIYGSASGHGSLMPSDLAFDTGDQVYVTVRCLRSSCRVVGAKVVGRAGGVSRWTKPDSDSEG